MAICAAGPPKAMVPSLRKKVASSESDTRTFADLLFKWDRQRGSTNLRQLPQG
jgi:hypothetical protein